MRASLLLGLMFVVGCGDKDPTDDTAPGTDDSSVTTDDSDPGDDTGEVDNDQDGDGYDAVSAGGDDCDDADASVNPGATEVWYDGTDQDCDGNDDDQDGDGSAGPEGTGPDCDDTDASVNPGATEVWYDGTDQDCDGNDDDQDGDGYAGPDESGADCDDQDAAVNPDASDSWYDGVDSDCDGASDYDQDGDGEDSDQHGGTDCDDEESSINTAASEDWYDGVDGNCDGASDYDQDGDGEDSDAHGGTDCDDTDAAVNTGATDIPQNGTDEDCDGADANYGLSSLSAGDLLVTEVMNNPSAVTDSSGEYFEVLNNTADALELEGLVVAGNADGFTVSGSLVVAAGDYVVFGINDDPGSNGGVTVDYDWGSSSTFSLSNSSDSIVLSDGTTTFDSVVWDNGATFPDPNGSSMNLDTGYLNADDNDYGYHWCEGTTAISGSNSNTGTPGAANDDCGFVYSHAVDIQPIWDANCTGCHGSSAGLTLSTDAWSNIVSIASGQGSGHLIEPMEPENSYLLLKLEGNQSDMGGSGVQMPRGRSPLSSADQTLISDWIEQGAQH